jgi:hypothetical protein
MITRVRSWGSHHVIALTAAGEWAAGIGLAIAIAVRLSSSPLSIPDGGIDPPAPAAASCDDDSTTTAEAPEPAMVFLPEDTIVVKPST